jgi:hypothetical protein
MKINIQKEIMYGINSFNVIHLLRAIDDNCFGITL